VNLARRAARSISHYGWQTPAIACERGLQATRHWLSRMRFSLVTLGSVGTGTTIEDDVLVNGGANVNIGRGVHIGRGSCLLVTPAAGISLTIGDGSWISQGCVLVVRASMRIGRNVLIGEFTSLRDTTHRSDSVDVPIAKQGDILGYIDIGDDVWIGRGCLIQGKPGGTHIGSHSIIGANSVVTRTIPPNSVWAGAPARMLRART